MKSNVRSFIIAGSRSLAVTITTARAATNNWTGGNDKWENYTHWSIGHPPSLNDTADVITHAGNNAVTIDETTVDPDGFSATGGTCPCLPNTVQLTINGVFSPGAVLIDETACVGCINNAFTLTA